MATKIKWVTVLMLLAMVLLFVSKHFFDQYNQKIETAQHLGTVSSVFQDQFPHHDRVKQVLTSSGQHLEVPTGVSLKAGDQLSLQVRQTGLVYLCVNAVCQTARVAKVESLGMLKSLSMNNPTRNSAGDTLIGIGADGKSTVVLPINTAQPATTLVAGRDRYVLIRGQNIIDTQAQLILKTPLGRPVRGALLCESIALRCFEVIQS